MVNNLHIIKSMLNFSVKDDFYFGQIFKRRKDNIEMDRDQIIIDSFYIDSLEDYDKKLPYVINLCNMENARAYLRINKRNYNVLAKHMLKKVVDIVFTENCKALRNCFNSVAGEFHSDPDKKWIIAIDNDKNIVFKDLSDFLIELQIDAKKEPMIIQIPTKNGSHIITRPFNLHQFKTRFSNIDVHKDNCTLLYCP